VNADTAKRQIRLKNLNEREKHSRQSFDDSAPRSLVTTDIVNKCVIERYEWILRELVLAQKPLLKIQPWW